MFNCHCFPPPFLHSFELNYMISICFCNREFELEEEYVRARPDRIKSLWTEYSPVKHPDFPKWLALFLGKVARLLSEEEESAASLFGR